MTQVSEGPAPARTRAQITGRTFRADPWWQASRITAALLTIWVVYATVHVFTGHWYYVPRDHYLTPFFFPCINGECIPGSSSPGRSFAAVPPVIPYALVSLPFVLGFRLSCCYNRRARYRAFWRAPAACAVREPHAGYTGETSFPLIIRTCTGTSSTRRSSSRYSTPATWRRRSGSGVGSLIMGVNVVLPWCYTLSCHSCRHITGGRLKNFARHPVRYWAWTKISWLNARHMQLASITPAR
jgi:hypothetical protein